MADFALREILSRRFEYYLPSPTVAGELAKALTRAEMDYRRAHGKGPDDHLYDDWLQVEARDDEIVLSYTVEEEVHRAARP